ncbi:hypothetical protein [Marinobacter sp. V034]|uniref:hypothetical protein n=1 Tax=Marinobacter sp. V034 TaxID=3459610 RepID=UPI004044BEC7
MKAVTMTLRAVMIATCLAVVSACQSVPSNNEEIGEMVQAVEAAIDAPEQSASLRTIVEYGTDSRYYVMIRGWLVQELKGVESQRDVTRDPTLKSQFEVKAAFLQTAIRRIDLE